MWQLSRSEKIGPNRTDQKADRLAQLGAPAILWAVLVPDERNPALCDAGFFARAPDRGGLWIGRQLFARLASQVDTTTLPGEPAAADTGR